MYTKESFLTPVEIVAELDNYIIGQKEAKRNVAIALRNQWRKSRVDDDIKQDIMPNNILMIGATGVGKTEIARRMARIVDSPFVKVEASKFTEVGYVGRDVESMVRELVECAITMVKARKRKEVEAKAEQTVEEQILDALMPPVQTPPVSVDNAQEAADAAYAKEQTRAQLRQKLRDGELEDRRIDIKVQKPVMPGMGVIGSNMVDETAIANLQDMISKLMPKRSKRRVLSIGDARKILLEQEVAKLIDMDAVKEEALKKAQETGIVFIDEIDKIAAEARQRGGPDISREGVQRDLLPIVEGSTVTTKYGSITTDHILFIAAGAFHVAKPSDLIPEFQGRFPIRVELEDLTETDFCRILKEPKNALLKQYEALFAAEGVDIAFKDDAVGEIAASAFKINNELENIGARRLYTVLSYLLNDFLFDVPDRIGSGQKIAVTKALVRERLTKIADKKDVSQYIL